MWATWMVTVNGWILAPIFVLALAGCLLVGLVLKDEWGYAKDRRMDRQRRAARARDHSR